MTQANCPLRCASRLLPATLASLVSLFGLAPAETMINRLVHRPPHAGQPVDRDVPLRLVISPHAHGPHENPAMWLERYAFKPLAPREENQPGCTGEHCFDPDAFQPAAGHVHGHAAGGGQQAAPDAAGNEPPANVSGDAQIEIAGLDEFAHDHGSQPSAGPSGQHAHRGSSGGGDGDGAGEGGPGGGDGPSYGYVLLPGSGTPGQSGAPGGGGSSGDPAAGDGGNAGGGGSSGGGSGPGSFPAAAPGGGGNGSGGEPTDDEEGETLSLRVTPAAGALDVASPATITMFAVGVALLALGRRRQT